LAKGKYFVFLDHDDVFLTRDHLQKLFDFLETHPDYGIVASYIINIDEHGKELHRNFGRISDEEIRSHLLQACQFTPCSMMIRKEAVQERGGFDKRYDRVDDYDLRMKIGRMRKMQMLPEYTAGYRIHTTNTSKSLKSQYQMKWLAWKVFWKNRNYYPNFRSALVLRICKFIIPSSTASFLVRLLRK
jgi:GT2 family glycosyltransferase